MQASRLSADAVRQIDQSQMGLLFNTDLHLDIGYVVSLEKLDKLCYLGNMLDAYGGQWRRSRGGEGGDRPPNKNIPGREYLFAPLKVLACFFIFKCTGRVE